jgi:hypothetical protein
VERADFPTSISATPSRLGFGGQGEDGSIEILGKFSDGSVLDVTESSLVTYSTSDSAVVRVDALGSVTSVAPGTATITATYGRPTPHIQVAIPVSVPRPLFRIVPSSLDFGIKDIGTASSQRMTLTNSTTAELRIVEVTATGDFSEANDCVSSSPLPVNAVCTITVTFRPRQAGLSTGRVRITNGFNGLPVGIWVSGTGR